MEKVRAELTLFSVKKARALHEGFTVLSGPRNEELDFGQFHFFSSDHLSERERKIIQIGKEN